jgi:hypothetical protein
LAPRTPATHLASGWLVSSKSRSAMAEYPVSRRGR